MKKTIIFAFGFIGAIGLTTAVPLVFFGLLGRWLDQKYGTGPYLMLLGFVLATVIVYFAIKRLVREAIKEFDKINKE